MMEPNWDLVRTDRLTRSPQIFRPVRDGWVWVQLSKSTKVLSKESLDAKIFGMNSLKKKSLVIHFEKQSLCKEIFF
jgi:hypothetical protein